MSMQNSTGRLLPLLSCPRTGEHLQLSGEELVKEPSKAASRKINDPKPIINNAPNSNLCLSIIRKRK